MILSLIAKLYYTIGSMSQTCEHKELKRVGKSLVWACEPCVRFFGVKDVTESVTNALVQKIEA